MGLSLSLLLSAWKGILRHSFHGPTSTIETVIVRSLSFERKENTKSMSAFCFKKDNTETINMCDGSDKMITESSMSFSNWDSKDAMEEATNSSKSLVLDREGLVSISSKGGIRETIQITKPTISVPEPVVFFSPRPVNELDAAATKLQKVYKSYRTRRNLADCAVLVEELWWKTLDSAALKQWSVSFFNIEKQESAVSRWARAKRRAAKVGKGLSKDEKAQKLALQHWLEAIDPRHRYGHNLHFYYDVWSDSKSTQPFFYWLDIGDGKELNLDKCQRIDLQCQCIKYLGPKEREAYEVIVENGKLLYMQSGMFLSTDEGSKWIFVLSTSRALYVGQKKKGVFQHSSFLSGGATTAAGRLVAHDGVLEAIWPYSGHYLPTEDNFKEFISFLEENSVDLTSVKRCAVDEEDSYKATSHESKLKKLVKGLSTTAISTTKDAANAGEPINNATNAGEQDRIVGTNAGKMEAPTFILAKPLSCKWTSGVGPRIGCVREYPTVLQSQALEQVNLSPRDTPGYVRSCLPIPSPRPSPKIRVSPRLAYMGLPSPRVSVTTSG